MKRKILRGIRISLIVILLIITVMVVSDPLIKTEKGIENDMLKLTPIGTSMKGVISVIDENEKWEIDSIDKEYGENSTYSTFYRKLIITSANSFAGLIVVGVHYYFDKDSKLIDIDVEKMVFAP